MIELKARCTGNAQDTAGRHTATLVAENGTTTFNLPSEDLAFIPGNTYKVSIDGEFAKPPAKPTPVKAAAPAPFMAPKPVNVPAAKPELEEHA